MQVKTIAEQLFFTTVRIDTVAANGAQCAGTGFLFAHSVDEQTYPFVVTNKHVVNDMKSGALTFLQRNGEVPRLGEGYRLAINDWQNAWFGHPSADIDIAICPFLPLEAYIKAQNIALFYRYVSSELIPTSQQVTELDAVESVTFIGYPNGVWDSKNLLPIARRGTTASPIEVDFEGTPRFLIDASVFGGSSGSPVFILDHGPRVSKDGGIGFGATCFHFVGVIAAVFFRTQLNSIIAVPIPTQVQPMAQQQEMIDLGIVFKARTVVETIEAFLRAHSVDASRLPNIPQA